MSLIKTTRNVMPDIHHLPCHYDIFGIVAIENRVRNFILNKAVGLLQSLQAKTLPESFGDIESGLLNASQSPPTSDGSHCYSGRGRSRNSLGGPGSNGTHVTYSPSNEYIEKVGNGQPQFTEGPACFVTANDGSKDCVALLVTDKLIAQLRDIYEDSHHLSGKHGPLDFVRREVRHFETSINRTEQSIKVTENEGKIAELQDQVREKEHKLLRLRRQRDELENSATELERGITSSKAHIQWVLHNAMKEADLLGPHRPLTPIPMTKLDGEPVGQGESKLTTNDDNSMALEDLEDGADNPKQHSVCLASIDEGPEELQLLRRDACESYNKALVTRHKVQALFDGRQQSYEIDLADYQQGFAKGIYDISRSEFDRSKIRYGHKLTRALIDAEAVFEAAKEQAQAVGAFRSDYDDATSCYNGYEESWPESQIASYLATKDWNHVHQWLADVPEPAKPGIIQLVIERGTDAPEIDDWYADEVDAADSISQVDFDEWRKDIDRWETIRFERWEEMRIQCGGPEVQAGFLVRNTEFLKRRHSIPLCQSPLRE